MLRGECAPGLVRVDDDRGRGKLGAGQVMIGDQHVDAGRGRRAHAVDARDAVVDGDDQARRLARRHRDDLRREAVAELEAVGHQVMRVGAHRAQAAHADRARGGAVGVVIADDDDPLAAGDRVREALRGGADVREAREIGERAERVVELRRVDDAARRVDAREHRRDDGVPQTMAWTVERRGERVEIEGERLHRG